MYTNAHGKLSVCRLTDDQRRQTCGYRYTVHSNNMSHTAFDTRSGLDQWLSERGLSLERPGEIAGPGHGWTRIVGEYRTTAHLCSDPAEVETMAGLKTRTLSNGDYVVAVIVTDPDGTRNVHTLNPNVRNRTTFNHRESDILMGGMQTEQLEK